MLTKVLPNSGLLLPGCLDDWLADWLAVHIAVPSAYLQGVITDRVQTSVLNHLNHRHVDFSASRTVSKQCFEYWVSVAATLEHYLESGNIPHPKEGDRALICFGFI